MSLNTINDFQEILADILSADTWLREHDVSIVPENRLEVESEIEAALAGVGMVATIVTPDVEGIGTYEGCVVAELPEFIISVAELVAINRSRPGACTALDAAARIVELLHGETRTFRAIRQTYEPERGLVICNVSFAAATPVALTEPTTEE
jgi:hypothetical protein